MSRRNVKSHVLRDTFYDMLAILGIEQSTWHRKLNCSGSIINRSMFQVPNSNIFQVISYFLFSILDTRKCSEDFYYLWPIPGKKEEQEFRKLCLSWLTTLSQKEGSHFPTFTSSLLLSPRLDKFYHLYMAVARVALTKMFIEEYGQQKLSLRYMKLLNTEFTSSYYDILVSSTQRYVKIYKSREATAQGRRNAFTSHIQVLVEQNHQLRKNISKYILKNSAKKQCEEELKKLRELWSGVYEQSVLARTTGIILENILGLTQTSNVLDGKENLIKPSKEFIQKHRMQFGAASVDQIYKGEILQLENLLKTVAIAFESYHELHKNIVQNFQPQQTLTHAPVLDAFAESHRSNYKSLIEIDNKMELYFLPKVQAAIQELEKYQDTLSMCQSQNSQTEGSSKLNIMRMTPNFDGMPRRDNLWTQSLRFTPIEKGTDKHQLLRKDCDVGCSPELQIANKREDEIKSTNTDLNMDVTPKSTLKRTTKIPILRGSQIHVRNPSAKKLNATKSPLECIEESEGFKPRNKLRDSPLTNTSRNLASASSTITPKNRETNALIRDETPEVTKIIKTIKKKSHSPYMMSCIKEMNNAFDNPWSFVLDEDEGIKNRRKSTDLFSSLDDNIMNESLPEYDMIDFLSPIRPTPRDSSCDSSFIKSVFNQDTPN